MLNAGDQVTDPRPGATWGRLGTVLEVTRNPACLMRTLTVSWLDGETEDVEETLFGPLED
ncbi:MAG: hypothetical protein ACYCO4_03160 [Sulfobacillus sp.]|jgi:hypothetical protein